MSLCELCGSSSDSLTKVKIEGTTLKVCDSCSDMGEEVGTTGKKKKKTSSRRSKTRNETKVLSPNYGQKVKTAREGEDLSIAELADEMNEKESVISKIEKQQFKPGKSLGKKLSKRLDINLYTNPEVADPGGTEDVDNRKATMEDVAEVK